jgi:CheY-like chemotaxis protein
VLVVEDNAEGRDSLAEMLRLLGHDVAAVGTGREAVEKAPAFRPTVALVDIGLPDISGHDVARALRSHPGLGGLGLVAITGWAQEEDRQRSVAAGFEHHLVKPVEPEILIALLAQLPARPAGA